jgi:hypothetical protein
MADLADILSGRDVLDVEKAAFSAERRTKLRPMRATRDPTETELATGGANEPAERLSVKEAMAHTNGFTLAKALVCEFSAVFLLSLIINITRAITTGSSLTGDLTVGLATGVIGCIFSMHSLVHLNPLVTIMMMAIGPESITTGFLRMILAQAGGEFAGAGLTRIIVGDANYANDAFVVTSTTLAGGWAIEFLGGIVYFFLIRTLYLSRKKINLAVVSTIVAFGLFALNAFAFSFTGACFSFYRWLAISAIGTDIGGFWVFGWWIYPVGTFSALGVVLVLHWLLRFLSQEEAKSPTYQPLVEHND